MFDSVLLSREGVLLLFGFAVGMTGILASLPDTAGQ
jgi:hypothetical protein